MKSITYTLPAYWASYLINGDSSGIDPVDKELADRFLKNNNLPSPVSCSKEAWLSRRNDAGTGLGDVMDYTFLCHCKRFKV